jgi:peroxiredoxin
MMAVIRLALTAKELPMPRVSIDSPAPDFTLPDYAGHPVSLADYRGQIVFLVLNRGFT